MNSFWTLIPIILIRFGLLGILDKKALKRAAFFPSLVGKEKTAYWFYQIANVLIFLYLFFLEIRMDYPLFYIGLAVYGFGIIVCIVSTFNFAKRSKINRAIFYIESQQQFQEREILLY